ncbi:MAG: hypothetical protein ACRDID_07220, partial [Ktedonobacterales bacterium]
MSDQSHPRRRSIWRRWLRQVAHAWVLYLSPHAARSAWPWLVMRARLLPADLRWARAATLA